MIVPFRDDNDDDDVSVRFWHALGVTNCHGFGGEAGEASHCRKGGSNSTGADALKFFGSEEADADDTSVCEDSNDNRLRVGRSHRSHRHCPS